MASKTRNFDIVQQLCYWDLWKENRSKFSSDKECLDSIINSIFSHGAFSAICAIIHDRDIGEDGVSVKAPHVHIVPSFSSPSTFEVCSNHFGIPDNYIQPAKSLVSRRLYLIHRNNPDKFQYSPNEVVSYGFDYIAFASKYNKPLEKFDREKFMSAVSDGSCREFNRVDYISMADYVSNKRFVDYCFSYQYEVLSREVGRELRCIYVCGPAGVGKTRYVKEWCSDHKLSLAISAAGTHFLESYKGQDALLLDDFRSSDIKFNDFLKICDNYTSSDFSARYHNKSLLYCRYLFVTSTVPITDLYFKDDSSHAEELEQLYRRFVTRIDMDFDFYRVSVYSNKKLIRYPRIPNVFNNRNIAAIQEAALKAASPFIPEGASTTPEVDSFDWVSDDGQEVLPF